MSDDKKLYRKKILSVKRIVKNRVYQVLFARNLSFKSGQVVALTTDFKIPPRLYSIASGRNEDELRIIFDLIPEGVLTSQLSKCKKGDIVYVSDPFGEFICDDSPAYWIASGTGIAPFASMFFSGLSKNKILIHGGRRLDSFYFEYNFAPALGKNYIRCCSQEKADGIFDGRLTDYLRASSNLPTDYKYYLCGSSEMVVETRDVLISKGIPFDKIIAEIYF